MTFHPYQRHQRKIEQEFPEISISETGNIRSLHLGSKTVQSAMNTDNPSELVLSYSRTMMAFLLFRNQIQHITHIGLGGGSLVRWIDTYLPKAKQLAIEINPKVIQIAKSMFELPFESEQFKIIEADAAAYIKVLQESTDIILTDGFDGEDIIQDLVSEDFFHHAYQALKPQGIFVTNWWSGDPEYPHYVARLAPIFKNLIIEIPAATHGNMIVLAFKNLPTVTTLTQLKKRAEKLTHETITDFNELFYAIKSYQKFHNSFLSN